MDALASDGHIGLIYAENPDGSDQIIEAKGEAYGTSIWTRTYRGSSSYSGVRSSAGARDPPGYAAADAVTLSS